LRADLSLGAMNATRISGLAAAGSQVSTPVEI